jgi:tRNA ligase
MAQRDQAPYKPQNVGEVSAVLEKMSSHLKKTKGKGTFSCKKTTFTLPNGQAVDSWKMQDWDYKLPDLPTYARGLFTTKNSSGQPEIVVRGYDKFFNHGEVPNTEWENVEKSTRGPYELSIKENGCIIFIAGMEDGSLIVCSKHSTGARGDVEVSHAMVGERWVDRHLATVGKTRADLARQLRAMNATAVAELCDDAFEEHVLAYNPEQAGLYLHGINLNLPEFATYPGHLVDRFAEDWGFKKTMYIMENDILQVKKFLDEVAETGAYDGRETEGFVIRCQSRDNPNGPWEDWFFKYKFDEPYLMYRQWRECTKAVIAGWTPKIRKHKKITEEYLLYARRRLAQDPNLGKLYNHNHGIIALRDDFLASRGLKGSDIIRNELENGDEDQYVTKDVVLVPIATIGCGKTTVGKALCHLFGWGQYQNDDIQGPKQRAARYVQALLNELALHPVVFADRNNHQRRERDQLIKDISNIVPKATFVALHYVHEPARLEQIRMGLRERVLNRGDNHQTIQAGTESQGKIIGIMDGFMHRFEPCDTEHRPDSQFDMVINLDPLASSRDNLETVISRLEAEYPKLFGEMPTAADLDKAIDAALNNYKADVKHDLSGMFGKRKVADRTSAVQNSTEKQPRIERGQAAAPKSPKEPKLEFFAVRLPAHRINAILETIFRDKDADTARFYRQLCQVRRVQSEFHVTLIHKASASQHAQYWEELSQLHQQTFTPAWETAKASGAAPPEPELGICQVQLERIVWDTRIMCFVVRLVNGFSASGPKFETVNKMAHVTVGTSSPAVKPKESNDLLARWLKDGSGEGTTIWEEKIAGNVVLEGSVRGVLSKF